MTRLGGPVLLAGFIRVAPSQSHAAGTAQWFSRASVVHGEAVARLSDEFITDYPQVEWRKVKGMRNIVSHEYAHIDYEIVWTALADRIPAMAIVIRDILAERERIGAGWM